MPTPIDKEYEDKKDRFELWDATRHPGKLDAYVNTRCPVCRHRIILHCESCELQVTGCNCTKAEKAAALEEAREAETATSRLWRPGPGELH